MDEMVIDTLIKKQPQVRKIKHLLQKPLKLPHLPRSNGPLRAQSRLQTRRSKRKFCGATQSGESFGRSRNSSNQEARLCRVRGGSTESRRGIPRSAHPRHSARIPCESSALYPPTRNASPHLAFSDSFAVPPRLGSGGLNNYPKDHAAAFFPLRQRWQ